MQLLRGGQLTAIHPLISADTMLELVLGVGGGRLEADCGVEDLRMFSIIDLQKWSRIGEGNAGLSQMQYDPNKNILALSLSGTATRIKQVWTKSIQN